MRSLFPFVGLSIAAALLVLPPGVPAHSQDSAPSTAAPVPVAPVAGAPASDSVQAIDKARAKLAKVEAARKGDTLEFAQALNELISAQLDEEQASPETLEMAARELKVAESAGGKRCKAFVAALSDNSEVRVALNRPAEARPYAEQALEIAEKEFADSEEGITAADELSYVCIHLNDLECAKRAQETAIAIERKPGPDHDWDLAYTLSNYSDTLRRLGDEKGSGLAAEECLSAVLRSRPNDPHVGIFENALGTHYMRSGDFPKAIAHLNSAIDRLTKVYGPHSAWVMDVTGNLASVYSRSGQFPLAWQKYEIALQNKNAIYDNRVDQHCDFARSLAAGGNLQRAIEEALLASRMGRESFVLQARILPERQALAFERRREHGLDTALSVLARHPDLPAAEIYEEMIHSRALVADEMARRQRNLNAANDPETARLLEELNRDRADLLNLEQKPAAKSGNESAIAEATGRMEKVERRLAERVAAIREDEAANSATLDDVRRALPPHSALISYWAFSRRAVEKVDPVHSDTPAYLAIVLRPETAKVRVIDLVSAQPIEDAVTRMRASAHAEAHNGGVGSTRNERAYREAGAALRKLVWDPLQAALGDAQVVIVVPDHTLNLVPFASLPDGTGYLADRKRTIQTVSSERDLLAQHQQARRSGLLAIGSPQFDFAENTTAAARLRETTIPCDVLQTIQFAPLAGAALELRDLGDTWHRLNPAEPAVLFIGDQATRERFLEAAPRARVLHVATHAFVLDRACDDGNPLLHSGLVFAGANHDREGSILTAQQIASLDLSGVEWAVLSACNTGTGVLSSGEGVLGLERAFRIAGVRSVVMTLWPVEDRITARFTSHLYRERLERHVSIADAVWQSNRALLEQRRAAGQSTHPWYWAGFVASGWDSEEPPPAPRSLARK
ncbi:MAG TPA: CHAT domain-containing protein [Terracidiphilus sp.]